MKYQTFEEFWPFYLSQHSNRTCRNLHLFGSTLAILWWIGCLISFKFTLIWVALVIAYGFAWIGHFVFEKNKPATFTYPTWSFQGDLKMLGLFYSGKLTTELQRFQIR